MSRPDLSATALAELETGSHRARNARSERMLQAQFRPVHWAWVAAFIGVLCAATFGLGYCMEPPSFNPFNR